MYHADPRLSRSSLGLHFCQRSSAADIVRRTRAGRNVGYRARRSDRMGGNRPGGKRPSKLANGAEILEIPPPGARPAKVRAPRFPLIGARRGWGGRILGISSAAVGLARLRARWVARGRRDSRNFGEGANRLRSGFQLQQALVGKWGVENLGIPGQLRQRPSRKWSACSWCAHRDCGAGGLHHNLCVVSRRLGWNADAL